MDGLGGIGYKEYFRESLPRFASLSFSRYPPVQANSPRSLLAVDFEFTGLIPESFFLDRYLRSPSFESYLVTPFE